MKEFLELNPEGIFDEIEEYILSQPNPKLALSENKNIYKIKEELSLEELLKVILKVRRFYASINPDTNQAVCGRYDHSIITDIFRLVNYYKPNTKLKDIYVTLVYGAYHRRFRSWICNGIKRRTYDSDNDGFTSKLVDEYGVKFPTPPSGYFGYGMHNNDLNFIKYKKDV